MEDIVDIVEFERDLESEILHDLGETGNDEFKEKLNTFPFWSPIFSGIKVPKWMFRKYSMHPELNLTDVEKICLATAMHYTRDEIPTGYMECSGLVERMIRANIYSVTKAFDSLVERELVLFRSLSPEECYGHKRNRGFIANIPKLKELLTPYNEDVFA